MAKRGISVRKAKRRLVNDLDEYSLDMWELIVYENNMEIKMFPFKYVYFWLYLLKVKRIKL